jgi:hypothetical protein
MTDALLRPCPACARHARVSEDACPFCGERFAESFRAGPRPQPPTGRLTRAALFALGTGALGFASGCGTSGSPLYGGVGGGSDIEEDGGNVTDAAAEGSPVADATGANATMDGSSDAPVTESVDGGNFTVPYGLPGH